MLQLEELFRKNKRSNKVEGPPGPVLRPELGEGGGRFPAPSVKETSLLVSVLYIGVLHKITREKWFYSTWGKGMGSVYMVLFSVNEMRGQGAEKGPLVRQQFLCLLATWTPPRPLRMHVCLYLRTALLLLCSQHSCSLTRNESFLQSTKSNESSCFEQGHELSETVSPGWRPPSVVKITSAKAISHKMFRAAQIL